MEEYLTIPQLAKIMGISRIAVYKKVTAGLIKAKRIGRTYAIPKSAVPQIASNAPLAPRAKKEIERSVKKTVKEYGETLKLLGNE